jgi:predicted nuclease of predicted toxin-antitoxin system
MLAPTSYLLDENVDVRLGKILAQSGAVVKRVPQGATDRQVFALAKRTNAILITSDSDFVNTLLYPPTNTAGIIVFSVHPSTLINLVAAISRLHAQFDPQDLKGKLFIITSQGIMIQQ